MVRQTNNDIKRGKVCMWCSDKLVESNTHSEYGIDEYVGPMCNECAEYFLEIRSQIFRRISEGVSVYGQY